jgi:hypothetical protein
VTPVQSGSSVSVFPPGEHSRGPFKQSPTLMERLSQLGRLEQRTPRGDDARNGHQRPLGCVVGRPERHH